VKKLTFISVLAMVIVACFAVNTFAADFYVISAPKEVMRENYAPVEKSGQATSYRAGDDGDLEKGIAWPNPRFTDNSNGTVKDNLTGLIWLKNANCSGATDWASAIDYCNNLATGSCGLTDGSSAGDWRLPNRFELESLLDMAYYFPALSNTAGTAKWTEGNPFTGVQSNYYWSGTTYAGSTGFAWYVSMYYGDVYDRNKTNSYHVWPVRSDN
jgi:hypothetical protein